MIDEIYYRGREVPSAEAHNGWRPTKFYDVYVFRSWKDWIRDLSAERRLRKKAYPSDSTFGGWHNKEIYAMVRRL